MNKSVELQLYCDILLAYSLVKHAWEQNLCIVWTKLDFV